MGLLVKLFIKDKNSDGKDNRYSYIRLASLLGICLNIFLFIIKFIAGTVFGSVAITADAFNNLSDAGSSIIALISIFLSSKPADEEHPFGHERIEYVGSLIVALIIMIFSVELLKTSLGKIFEPTHTSFSLLMVVVLGVSILVKLYMYSYNTRFGKKLDSSIMRSTAADSLSDVLTTSVVLIGILIAKFFKIELDGYLGLIVAFFIAKSGYDIIKDVIDSLLGKAPDPEFIKYVTHKIKSYDGILGVHDLVVHSYGPQRTFISAHAEVSSKENVMKSHDIIDNIERDFAQNDHISLVIHMDPIVTDDPFTNEMRIKTAVMIQKIDTALSIHDFRVVRGATHNNIIFDVVKPFSVKISDEELTSEIHKNLPQGDVPNYAVITIDQAYSSKSE